MNRQLSLLLVDSDISFLDLTARRLSQRGFFVTVCVTGGQALMNLENKSFDLAVVSTELEDSETAQTVQAMKQLDQELPIVLVRAKETHRCLIRNANDDTDAADSLSKASFIPQLERMASELPVRC